MNLKGYLFALPKRGNDLHSQVFKALKTAHVSQFTKEKLQLCAVDDLIICRSNNPVENGKIATVVESYTFSEGDKVPFTISLTPKVEVALRDETGRFYHPKRSKYVSMDPESEDFKEYLTTLFEKHGMSRITSLLIQEEPLVYVNKAHRCFPCAKIVGETRITNEEKFANAFQRGIGRQKTYGFGMLRVIR